LNNHILTIVIAAKDPSRELLLLCLASFAALRHGPALDVVIIQSGELPTLPQDLVALFSRFTVIEVPPAGVYAAYNAGIPAATGSYVLFFGADDVALPGMDTAIDAIAKTPGHFHLYAAACYMQSVGISTPSRWRASLAARNWCHQGIFYLRSYLLDHPYQTEYHAQADHKMNIDIVSNRSLRFGVSTEVVAYFSAGGVSSVRPDIAFRRDFPSIVTRAYGWPLGALVKLKQLLIDAVRGDPEKRFQARLRR
jgi:glycosyltransferase involved in cell wall biosynthesis